MKTSKDEKSRYRITDSHRNQSFVGIVKRDRDTYEWRWTGHIDFTDGHNVEFASQRSFTTKAEAEECMRRFACDHIDNRLSLTRL